MALYYRNMNDVQTIVGELRNKGWTLAAIADEVGTHRETVSRWLSGQYYPENAKAVLVVLNQLADRKRIPKRRRYAEGQHHTQRKSQEAED